MPKKPKRGRPEAAYSAAPIDLDELEKLCAMQCTQSEVAAFFGVSVPTIERRRKTSPFRERMDRGYAKGRLSIRRRQMQMLEAGNATMAVWLGKQYLGQRDRTDTIISGPEGGAINLNVSARDEFTSRIASVAARLRALEANSKPE